MVIVSMYLLGFGRHAYPPNTGGHCGAQGDTMQQDILAFAESMFPNTDTLTALEMLLIHVYATIDCLIFAQEDAQEYPEFSGDADDVDAYAWDYVY